MHAISIQGQLANQTMVELVQTKEHATSTRAASNMAVEIKTLAMQIRVKLMVMKVVPVVVQTPATAIRGSFKPMMMVKFAVDQTAAIMFQREWSSVAMVVMVAATGQLGMIVQGVLQPFVVVREAHQAKSAHTRYPFPLPTISVTFQI